MRDTRDLTITNAVVWGGEMSSITGGVRIIGGTITEIGADISRGEIDLDPQGRTVLPGLIDAHFHAYATGLHGTDGPLSYVALRAAERLGSALRRGFTTVRDVAGGDPGLARAIREGVVASPR